MNINNFGNDIRKACDVKSNHKRRTEETYTHYAVMLVVAIISAVAASSATIAAVNAFRG